MFILVTLLMTMIKHLLMALSHQIIPHLSALIDPFNFLIRRQADNSWQHLLLAAAMRTLKYLIVMLPLISR